METYPTLPVFPERISRIGDLASDLWWSWRPAARTVFRTLDYPLWRITAHNPVLMLRSISPERLEQVVRDAKWLAYYDEAITGLDEATPGGALPGVLTVEQAATTIADGVESGAQALERRWTGRAFHQPRRQIVKPHGPPAGRLGEKTQQNR